MLLSRCPHADIAALVDLDVNHIRLATDGAVLHVLLAGAARKIDGHDDLLAAEIADVAGLLLHDYQSRFLAPYRQEYGAHGLWVRPAGMFLELVVSSLLNIARNADSHEVSPTGRP